MDRLPRVVKYLVFTLELVILLAIAAGVVAIWIGWVGYSASDDAAYYEAALRWLDHPPVAGDDHWATRFPLILSLAGMIVLLGKGAAAMGVTARLVPGVRHERAGLGRAYRGGTRRLDRSAADGDHAGGRHQRHHRVV